MKRVLWISLIIFSQLFGQIPEWAKNYNHKKYPSSQYFLGVGIGKDQISATEAARADLAKQIQVRIDSELETIESEYKEKNRVFQKSEVVAKTKTSVEETIAGIQIVEVQKVKDKFYVLAALHKAKYLASLQIKMDDLAEKINELVSSGRKLALDGKIFAAVNSYYEAQNSLPDLQATSLLYTALSGSRYPVAQQIIATNLSSEIRSLLSGISLQIISGNNQIGDVGKPLPQPVVLKVTSKIDDNEVGLSSFPIIYQYEGGSSSQTAISDDNGIINLNINCLPTDPSNTYGRVKLRLDIGRLPDIFRTEIKQSEVFIEYRVNPSNLKFAIKINENSIKLIPTLNQDLEQLIVNTGFKYSNDSPYCLDVAVTITNQREIPTPSGKQYLTELKVKFMLVEKGTQKLINSLEATGKGVDTASLDGAIEKAYRNAINNLAKDKFAVFLQSVTVK